MNMAGQGTLFGITGKNDSTTSRSRPYAPPLSKDSTSERPLRPATRKANALQKKESPSEPMASISSDCITSPTRLASSGAEQKHSERPTSVHNVADKTLISSIYTPTANHNVASSATSTTPIMRVPPCLQLDPIVQHLLTTASACPPVTKDTLSELDLNWIMNNISLRCDVNFDHDLHFMPITGKRGDEKRQTAHKYWLALAAELRIYLHNIQHCQACNKTGFRKPLEFPQRLPEMFQNLRLLLETLVPSRDHDQVRENVDVRFLMQQVEHGVFDAARMSSWLAKLLKTHCAPMRDEWADAMSRKIEEGATDPSMLSLVSGLEKLFSFLEAMKLDVANHQIRMLRYVLIEDTVSFQQQYFQRRIDSNKPAYQASRHWYDQAAAQYEQVCLASQHKPTAESAAFESLMHGLALLCTSDEDAAAALPSTLSQDQSRIQHLREEVQDSVYMQISLAALDQRVRRRGRQPSAAQHRELQSRLLALTDGEPGKSVADIWSEQVHAIALEVTRQAQAACVGGASTALVADEDIRATARQLDRQFCDSYAAHEAELLCALARAGIEHARAFQPLSALEMSEAQREWQLQRLGRGPFRHMPCLQDMGRRLAHIGVLHWRVWADLLYLDFDEEDDEDEEGEEEEADEEGEGEAAECDAYPSPSLHSDDPEFDRFPDDVVMSWDPDSP